jgi:hypothetical protein
MRSYFRAYRHWVFTSWIDPEERSDPEPGGSGNAEFYGNDPMTAVAY